MTNDQPTGYLAAQEAAEALGVSLPTLYSYVSRGLIRSEMADVGRRTHRYRIEDVQRLVQRKEQRRNPGKAVAEALHWGVPLLESALTLIADGRYYYRGRDALALAESHSIEQVAALLWTGDPGTVIESLQPGTAATTLPPAVLAARAHVAELPLMEQFQALLPLAAAHDLAAYNLQPGAVIETGGRIFRLMTLLSAGCPSETPAAASLLQRCWAPDDPNAAKLINAALVLCADHELNVSSFTARCIASAGATPYQVVMGGLAALQGVKHGRITERVKQFLQEVGQPERARFVIAARLKRGEPLPGFGHPLYPTGDPRGAFLLSLAADLYPNAPALALAQAVVDETLALVGERPALDFGLVAVARALDLPPGGSIAMFALGRTVGWVGHALEAYEQDRIIRPRARYVGQLPPESA